jgi:hypothetical protein
VARGDATRTEGRIAVDGGALTKGGGIMQSRIRQRRQLGALFAAPSADKSVSPGSGGVGVPEEFTPHDYAVFLLHVAAEIEHVLMVQYLYAGFALGGPGVPPDHQLEVARWQEIILGIAKEEMGHLMTVQNLLRCLGGALNLDREDFPWDSGFYPFPFRLEPLTRRSLAKYVVAESPEPELWTGPEADEIRALAREDVGDGSLHRVGVLYAQLRMLLEDKSALRDSDFHASSFPFQANWDEWGRGYRGGARGNTMGGPVKGTPDVILRPVASRSDAVAAVKAIAQQGEAPGTGDADSLSHFARFLQIFRAFPKDGTWSPSQDLAVNPVVVMPAVDDKSARIGETEGTPITHPQTRVWAQLFNVRYRALLTTLLHTFDYPSNLVAESQTTPRGLLIHATFGEMYNLRAIARFLAHMPLDEDGAIRLAGPPFQMPYTMKLPFDPPDRWRLHIDLLRASRALADRLSQQADAPQRAYLTALRKTDGEMIRTIEAISSW